uniref:Transmembrane protein 44 n=1 Tax=Fundulus heteroclitus TaxID=8078 RepID=A0A3Q2Q966_FUNHE
MRPRCSHLVLCRLPAAGHSPVSKARGGQLKGSRPVNKSDIAVFRILCQRCTIRGENSGESIVVLYSFLGNLCSTVGAVLSRQLHIQVAQLNAEARFTCCALYRDTRRLRSIKKRRRQHLLAVGVLMVVAGGFLRDNKEILGYILGVLACVIAWTSRFPALCRARRGQNLTQIYIFSEFLCSVSGALYTAAILLYDVQLVFLIRVMPWLLSSIGCVILDLLVSLCTNGPIYGRQWPTNEGTKKPLMQTQNHSNTSLKSNMHSFFKLCDLLSFLLQLFSLKKVRLAKDGSDSGPPHRMVRLVRVDNLCSSDTSYNSSSDCTDLEVS